MSINFKIYKNRNICKKKTRRWVIVGTNFQIDIFKIDGVRSFRMQKNTFQAISGYSHVFQFSFFPD